MARTVLGLSVVQLSGQQFSLNWARRLEIAKTNLGRYPEPLGLALVEEGETARFEYGEAPGIEPLGVTAACGDWLLDYLAEHGPSRCSTIEAAAKEAGYSKSAVHRARNGLGDAIATGRKYQRGKCWAVPGQVEDEV